MNEREFDAVMDDLTGMQARLRGEEPSTVAVPRVQILPHRADAPTPPDAIPTIRFDRVGDTVSVSHDDLTVFEETEGASVIPMHRGGDDRVAEIAARLARLETELTDVLRGLEDAGELLGPLPRTLAVEESTGDPLLDLQRLVARRMDHDPEV
ncbi:MAG: hypothetical protein ABI572_13065 [Actinomycetota bacterium]